MPKTKLFDLMCNGSVLLQAKPMPFIKAMQNGYKKQSQYKGCKFEIKYNSTVK